MKRVHNDQGASPKNGSPPPSNAPARGKKRKVEPNDNPVARATKRDPSPPAVAVKPQEPSLADRWTQSGQTLLEIAKQLNDPMNAGNMTLLGSASDCLKVMAQTTRRLNASGSSKQESG